MPELSDLAVVGAAAQMSDGPPGGHAQTPPPPSPVGIRRPGSRLRSRHLAVVASLRDQRSPPLIGDGPGCGCCADEDAQEPQQLQESQALREKQIVPVAAVAPFGSPRKDAADDGTQARRDYAAEVLRAVRERKEFSAAKTRRVSAERELRAHRARVSALAGLKDPNLREFALKRSAPSGPLPSIPQKSGVMPRCSSVQALPTGTMVLASYHAQVPKIDFHQHCVPCDEEGLLELIAANKAWGVEAFVLLSLRLPSSNRKDVRVRNDWVLQMAESHPEVVPFVTVIEDDPKAAKMFESCLDRGAKGLKLIGWHSNYIKKYDYDLRHPALMDVFRVAATRRAPVLIHLWVGYSETKRDYLSDLEAILSELPDLPLVLAHFGLGFDPETLPGISELLGRHRNLYVDTSLYGTFCELWFSRASNQAAPLADMVRRFPRQILFGSDVFGSRRKRPAEYADALVASINFVSEQVIHCKAFKRTSYFDDKTEDKYGLVTFDPKRLRGLGIGDDPDLLDRVYRQNARDILQLA